MPRRFALFAIGCPGRFGLLHLASIARFVFVVLPSLVFCTESAIGQSQVYVDDFGAAGDGVTWDHGAIQNAIKAVGIGGTIIFTPGKTYVACRPIALVDGLHVVGNGATIRRCDRVNTTLTAPAAAGDTYLYVDDASRYELGMWVAPISSPTHDGGEYASRGKRNVQEILGNTIQISAPLRQSYAAGSTVITIDDMMIGVRDNVIIEGLIFDGNRRNNDDWVAWENGVSVYLYGSDNTIRNNIFVDCWSTCVDYFGGPADIIDNYFQGAASAALHLSSVEGLNFSGNQINDTNTLASEAGHSEAAVTWSAFNKNIRLADNCVSNSGTGVFGQINRKWNNDVLIENNYACGAASFFSMYKSVLAFEGFEHDGYVTVRNNVAVNVGRSSSSISGVAEDSVELMKNFTFSENQIVNGYLDFGGLDGALIEGNTIWMLDESAYGNWQASSDNSRAGMISLSESRNVSILENHVRGGSKGIYLRNNDGFVLENVTVDSNDLVNNQQIGIATGDLDWLLPDGANAWKADHSGIVVQGNTVVSDLIALESEAGIVSGHGVHSSENCVDVASTGARIVGVGATGAGQSPSTWHDANSYLGSLAGVRFVDPNFVSEVSLVDNVVSTPIPSEFESANGSVVSGNSVDAAASCPAPSETAMPECIPCASPPVDDEGVSLRLKVLLEGPYAGGGLMAVSSSYETGLQTSATFQPYGHPIFQSLPAFYLGSEFTYPSFPSGVIDWIVVALRRDETAGSEIVRQAALVMENGNVVRPDGSPDLIFPTMDGDSCYVVVYHRNHLAAMSSERLDLSEGHAEWDFRTSASAAYGQGQVGFQDGFFGLWAGDGRPDGHVTAVDFNTWLQTSTSGTMGYLPGDYNMDGEATAVDFNLWIKNTTSGAQSRVPD